MVINPRKQRKLGSMSEWFKVMVDLQVSGSEKRNGKRALGFAAHPNPHSDYQILGQLLFSPLCLAHMRKPCCPREAVQMK